MEQILTIHSEIPAKKNNYRISKSGGMYKPKEIVEFEELISGEVMAQRIKALEPEYNIFIDLVAYTERYKSADADNMLTSMLDALELAGVIPNDKYVVDQRSRKVPAGKGYPVESHAVVRIGVIEVKEQGHG